MPRHDLFRYSRRLLAYVVVVFVLAIMTAWCANCTASVTIGDGPEWKPPLEVRLQARTLLQQCTGYTDVRMARFDRIHWKLVDSLPEDSLIMEIGETARDFQTVSILRGWERSVSLVAHEGLHVIIARPGHPSIPFESCGVMWPTNP